MHSPSIKKPLPDIDARLIVDCHTYFLARKGVISVNDRLTRAFDHYSWLIKHIPKLAQNTRLTFVVPDCDWMGKDFANRINDLWIAEVDGVPCLAMPSESHYQKVSNIVGHCLRNTVSGPAHPDWTHTFAQPQVPLSGSTRLWTYDSISELECVAHLQKKVGPIK